jgi:hypothetical protein
MIGPVDVACAVAYSVARVLYATRLGPMEDDEGEATFWYLGFTKPPEFRSLLATQDEDGLRRLAKLCGKGQLQCEPALAAAGKKLGFVSRPMPEFIRQARGFAAYFRGLGPYGGVLDRDDLPLGELLAATTMFMNAKPWRWWSDWVPLRVWVMGSIGEYFEGSLAGLDSDDFGISLYERAGALDRIALALDAKNVLASLREDGMTVTVTPGPEWAAEPMEEAYGFRGIPAPLKLRNGKMGEIDPLSLTILCAALQAASRLRPDNLTGSADLSVGETRIRLTIQAPAPSV